MVLRVSARVSTRRLCVLVRAVLRRTPLHGIAQKAHGRRRGGANLRLYHRHQSLQGLPRLLLLALVRCRQSWQGCGEQWSALLSCRPRGCCSPPWGAGLVYARAQRQEHAHSTAHTQHSTAHVPAHRTRTPARTHAHTHTVHESVRKQLAHTHIQTHTTHTYTHVQANTATNTQPN